MLSLFKHSIKRGIHIVLDRDRVREREREREREIRREREFKNSRYQEQPKRALKPDTHSGFLVDLRGTYAIQGDVNYCYKMKIFPYRCMYIALRNQRMCLQ